MKGLCYFAITHTWTDPATFLDKASVASARSCDLLRSHPQMLHEPRVIVWDMEDEATSHLGVLGRAQRANM
jgi:hypothetical protein